ncbi:MAG: flagellar brake domain-containing protein [Lachnospiraceae bacterium]|nr:flagellar brake domain-containing protein [Lachnospiraceae bacterium]
MTYKEIKPGLKVNIRFVQEANRQSNKGEEASVFVSRIFDISKDGLLELDMPTRGGKLLLLPVNVRYEFIFISETGMYKAEGTIKERFKRGNFYLIKAQLLTKLERFQRREYYRLNCLMPISFSGVEDNVALSDDVTELFQYLESEENKKIHPTILGTIVDISGGGLRAVSEKKIEDVNYCDLQFYIEVRGEQQKVELMAKLIAVQKVEESKNYQYRFKFLFKDSKMQETIIRFIFEEDRKIRKKEQG